MTQNLQLLLLGVGLGGAYALLALGVVTIYRGTGVPNFAQGAMAMGSAFAFFGLRDDLGWSAPLAFLVTILGSVGFGVAFYFLVMRQLRHAPVLARIVATVALVLFLRGFVLTFFNAATRTPRAVLPREIIEVFGIRLSTDRLYLALLAVVVAVVLGAVSRFTRIGLAVRAVSENEKGTLLQGYSPDLLSALTWGLGSLVAALAGILVSPIAGLDAVALTMLIVPVFASALIARFSSYTVALLAALAFGAVQSLLQKYSQPGEWWTFLWAGPGRREALPALVVIIAMVMSGKLIPSRGEISRGRPVLSPLPRHLVVGPIVVLVIGATILLLSGSSWANAASTSVSGSFIIISLVVSTGFLGQLSLAQMAFAGIGGLAAARFSVDLDVPFLLTIPIAAVAAGLLGVLVGLPSLRVRGPSLAIVTLCAGYIVENVIFQDLRFVKGFGFATVEPASMFGWTPSKRGYGLFALVLAIVVGLGVAQLRRSRFGRRALAIRENERAAAAAGISVRAYKLVFVSLSAAIAGIGGCLMVFNGGVFTPEQYTVFGSLSAVVMGYIGGIGMVLGSVFASLGVPSGLFPKLLHEWGVGSLHELIGGAALLVSIQLHPDGLASLGHEIRTRRARKAEAAGQSDGEEQAARPAAAGPAEPEGSVAVPLG